MSHRNLAPSLEDFERLAAAAFEAMPVDVRRACREVVIRIEDFPPQEMLDDLEMEDAFELTGLYDGTALTERSVLEQRIGPDVIWLFRRPILEEWIERGDIGLAALITHVLVHEVAHHLGWSDDDIRDIDDWTQ
jgi:predicted Zn-dependent protease with MMP-like domain